MLDSRLRHFERSLKDEIDELYKKDKEIKKDYEIDNRSLLPIMYGVKSYLIALSMLYETYPELKEK